LPVARHGDHAERHAHLRADGVAIAGREVAQDAAADLVALGLYLDPLGDGQRAVLADADAAVEVKNFFNTPGGNSRQQGDEKNAF
jgi:hypothetical protein